MSAPMDKKAHRCAALERIALDSIGALSRSDRDAWVREHLDSGCEICTAAAESVHAVFDALLVATRPIKPAASLRDRVLKIAKSERGEEQTDEPVASEPTPESIQVWNRWNPTERKFYTLPAEANPWQPTGLDGIEIRELHVDESRDVVTMLVRMAPGISYPRHRHADDEHCYVLQGDLCVEDQVLRTGDYQFAPKDSIHGEQMTVSGCTLLIVSSRSDELLPN